MKRRVLIAIVAACMGWPGALAVAHASTASTTTCTGDLSNQTIRGDLVVPDDATMGGQTCLLDNTTVTGSVLVQPGGDLEMRDGTHVNGSVVATQPERVSIHTQATNEPINVIGNNLSINGSSSDVRTSVMCGVRVNGSVTIKNVTRQVELDGDPGSEAGCDPIGGGTNGPVSIGGNVLMSNNAANVELSHATVSGSVTVTNNSVRPELEANTISNALSCSGNTGGVDNGNEPNTAGSKSGQCTSV